MTSHILRRTLIALAGLAFAMAAVAENWVATLATGGSPIAIALNPVTGKTYVANQSGGTVTIIDNATHATTTVTVGNAPWGLAVNPSTNRIYVANAAGNSVTVIDGSTDAVVASVATGAGTNAIALNAATNRIYTANFAAGTVTVIDGATHATTSVAVGINPAGLAVNPVTNRIYVANAGSHNVSVIDGATATVIATIPVGTGPVGVAVNPVTNRVFVTNLTSNSLTVIDGLTHGVVTTLATGNGPYAVAVNPVANRVYVANTNGDSVTVVNGTTLATSTVYVGMRPVALSVNAATHQVFVANENSDSVTVIDGAINAATTLPAGAAPRSVVVNPLTNRAYVANAGGSITVVDGWSSARTATIALPFPVATAVNPVTNKIYAPGLGNVRVIDGVTHGIATLSAGVDPAAIVVNPVTNKVYVANAGSDDVTVVDGQTNATVTVPAGNQPQSIDANPVTNRIYVANYLGNSVTVIDGATHATATVGAGVRPVSVAVNPATNRIYVANFGESAVTVIDGTTNETSAVAMAGPASLVAVNPATNRIYAVSVTANNVTVIDGATHATSVVTTGTSPYAIGINRVTNKIYVANANAGTVTVIDGATHATVDVVVGSSPAWIGINPVTNKIYVANQVSASVTVIDGMTNTATTMATGSGPEMLAVNPVTNRIYVANVTSDSITVIDEGSSQATSHAPAASLPLGFVTTRASPVLSIAVAGAYTPTDPPLRTVRFRQGDAYGAFAGTSGTGPYAAALTALVAGPNYVSMFALDAMEGTAIDTSGGGMGGASVITGAPRVALVMYLPVRVVGASLPNGTYGVSYAASVSAEGLLAPLSFSIGAGALPPGLGLDAASGQISGTAAAAGSFDFTVSATDPAGGAGSQALAIVIDKAPQHIQIGSMPNRLTPDSPPQTIPLTGGDSGNPVLVFSLTPSLCTANGPNGATVAFFGAGICQLQLSQAGGPNHLATQLGFNIAVKYEQAIDFAPLPDRRVGDPNFTLSATGGGSGNPVFFSSMTPDVCVLGGADGSVVALIAPGTCSIEAGQMGNGTYHQAPWVVRSFKVFAAGAPGAPVIGTATAANASIGVAFTAPSSIGSSAILDYTATCGSQSATGAGPPILVAGLSNGTAYTCTVVARNAAGTGPASAPSNSATPATPSTDIPRLVGISTRMQVLTGDNVMIGGVIIGGSTPKTVVVRARGPSLGIAGALADPTLTLVPASGPALANDDWGNAANAAALAASGYAPANAKESAILATLAPGAYTAIVSGVGDTSGVSLMEVYEVDHPEIPLVAISTRGLVQTGDNVMIGGFIIQGSGPQTVVVRARGPSLGVAGALADPTLTLVPSSGAAITNDDWGTAANAAALAASGFAPGNPKESAILVTLAPGAYTAIVSGVGNTSGVAIVEVYRQ